MARREFTESDLKWIKRFERVMKDAPPELFMFVNGGIAIYPERVMREGKYAAVDETEQGVLILTPMECDGGDY